MAKALAFERTLFLREEGVQLEGLMLFMGANARVFRANDDLVPLVRDSFGERKWTPAYSRHLIATRLHWSDYTTSDRLTGWFLFVDIENRRSDVAAFDTIARLEAYSADDREHVRSPNLSPLKVTGQGAYSQVIWPRDHGVQCPRTWHFGSQGSPPRYRA